MPPQLYVLVDLSNTDVVRGGRINNRLLQHRLDRFLDRTLRVLAPVLGTGFVEVRFRFYDGWFNLDGVATDLYSMTRGHLSAAYPVRQRNVRIFAGLADAPVSIRAARLFEPDLARDRV